MMRLRGAALLVTFSLLTSAATAYAECAWVLWQEKTTVSETFAVSREWMIITGRESRNECASALKKDIEAVDGKVVGNVYWKRLGALDVIEFKQRTEDGLDRLIDTTRYVCLHD